jgi:hypothetical protein
MRGTQGNRIRLLRGEPAAVCVLRRQTQPASFANGRPDLHRKTKSGNTVTDPGQHRARLDFKPCELPANSRCGLFGMFIGQQVGMGEFP